MRAGIINLQRGDAIKAHRHIVDSLVVRLHQRHVDVNIRRHLSQSIEREVRFSLLDIYPVRLQYLAAVFYAHKSARIRTSRNGYVNLIANVIPGLVCRKRKQVSTTAGIVGPGTTIPSRLIHINDLTCAMPGYRITRAQKISSVFRGLKVE